jgi:hypothetical protein
MNLMRLLMMLLHLSQHGLLLQLLLPCSVAEVICEQALKHAHLLLLLLLLLLLQRRRATSARSLLLLLLGQS